MTAQTNHLRTKSSAERSTQRSAKRSTRGWSKLPQSAHVLLILLILLILLAASSVPAVSQAQPAPDALHSAPHDPQTDAAFEDFYNMQYDRATQELEKILEKRPNDPFAVNHLLTVVLMHDLYDTGAMNTGDYANDSFIGRAPRSTDTKIKDRIKQLVHRAQELEEQEL